MVGKGRFRSARSLQAQHLDTDFYDTHFEPGAYLPTHATEQQRWNS